jgi:imidazolonepropionase-like amidohydrolase
MPARTRFAGLVLSWWVGLGSVVAAQPVAVVGATVIDGNGGPAMPNATVVVENGRIRAVGPRASVTPPKGARVVDGSGRFLIPGLIDTNVHLSLYGGVNERYETLVRYHARQEEIVLEAAQLALARGVTTVRDSYGMLPPLVRVRDRIARGEATGARILAAGNIVGWGGPYSISFSLIRGQGLTRFQEEMNDYVAQGAGEELMNMSPAELRAAINAYLDKGPDFLKYGGTSHFSEPTFIGFSPEAQKVIVEETKKRGKVPETHATTSEGLRLSVLAGIELIQHPEVLDGKELPDDLVALIREKDIVCAMLVNTITGDAWKRHIKSKDEADKKKADAEKDAAKKPAREKTKAELRKEADDQGLGMEMRRRNAQKLIRGGCRVTVGTDNYWAAAPELQRQPKPETQDHGIGTILAIEGLVELGMSPAQALVAGTRNGAFAAKGLKDYGTIEVGKLADLVLLDADPLADIGSIRKLRMVMKEGREIDVKALPEKRVLSTP